MMNLRKGYTLLLVGMMAMSGLVAFLSAPVVSADQDIRQDWLELVFNDAWQVDGLPAPVTDYVFDRQTQWNEFRAGEGDGDKDWDTIPASANTLNLQIRVVDADCDDLCINITGADQDSWWDFDDSGDSTSPDAYPVASNNNNINPGAGSVNQFSWNFDTLVTDYTGYGNGDTGITVSYSYRDAGSGPPMERRTGSFEIYIYLSTLYDNSGSTQDHVTAFPDLVEAEALDVDTNFEAGDNFVPTTLTVPNHLGESVSDIWVNVTPPTDSGITMSAGGTAWFPGTLLGSGATQVFNYRTNVAEGVLPGVYTGDAVIQYTTEQGLRITEPAAPIDWNVDYAFADTDPSRPGDTYSPYQMVATDVELVDDGEGNATKQWEADITDLEMTAYVQSSFSDKLIVINVTIMNNGNSVLYRPEFWLPVDDWGANRYFRNPNFFWVSAGTVTPQYDRILLTDLPDMAIGDTITFSISVIVLKEVPIGEHRLPISYTGFYFRDGSLGMATAFMEVNGGNNLTVLFSIVVSDPAVDCHVTTVLTTDGDGANKLDIRSETITVTIINDENYAFIDVLVVADFTGTPYYAPLIDTTTLQPPVPLARVQTVEALNANMATPFQRWDPAGGSMAAEFIVDTDPNMAPDRYPFSLTITAVIEETLDVVTTVIMAGAEFDFTGYGPEVIITTFTADEIIPGEHFDLDLTVENVGDDALRDIWITIPSDGTYEYPWNLERDFKDQFDWADVYNQWIDVTGPIDIPDDMFYTVEDLDVDNIREIIEINLYMDGVYSNPGSTINFIHVLELAPGASIQVLFDMIADKDMVNGKPYNVNVTITGIDPDGVNYSETQTLEVMSSLPGDSYNPVELDWFDAGLKLLGLVLFFIIVLAVLLWVYNKFKGEPGEEEDEDFDFEDDEPVSFDEPANTEDKPELVSP